MTALSSPTPDGVRGQQDWRRPYRSMDASGSPESAGVVGWEWINQVAEELNAKHPGEVMIDSASFTGSTKAMVNIMYFTKQTLND